MRNRIKLSKRLNKVASYLPKGAFFADIGSDHAYLPCFVCMHDRTARAIAGEINKGPARSAADNVSLYGLSDVVEVRLGDGLQVLKTDEISQLVIAGMGGTLIRSILGEGAGKLHSVQRIIAQPNIDARSIRRWFLENAFTITNEEIVEDSGHIYEIIVADRGEVKSPYADDRKEQQLLFGPLLLKNKTKAFYKKWKIEYEKLYFVINQMKKGKVQDIEKIERFETELRWMKEVLCDD
ncbi:tRNA (adenine(22)-N(1))-methyltransferase TrmK [Virgibacillus sp. NKC19-16]|uniref:tRNA (adenine(22)-N(1))-methyltransferase n=1 Tax=Virgibacillus salidurans TaxID=2831673 RepID=UPI001F42527A|nr:tRNA (adenine(22)-N(1))-methyltransferase TrmK [Virgibacillus sp. NKC19-16]UJL44864.1 tRNA (adenine(22)-N(1))-methyltransferase TrmK [Virgibacillus sp. NKC19-16]